jgi:signal transduction histidine kinase/ligand-binding sensor domain-containing protein
VTAHTIFRRAAAVLLLALHLHGGAAPAPLLADYTHTAWGGLQGAPVDVLKFAQTPDGWLWMATAIGLYRYDGVGFERTDTVYGQRLHSNDVIGLMAARNGALWVGYRFGGVSVFRKDGAQTFFEADGLTGGMVFHIEEAPDGAVWVATGEGVARLAPGARRFERQGLEAGLPGKQIYHVLFARDGTEWIGSAAGAFFRRPGERRFAQAWPRTALMSMAEGPDGAIWASDTSSRYYRVRTAPPPPGSQLRPEQSGSGLRFDRDGGMWLLRTDSVERKLDLRPDPAPDQRLTRASGLSGALPQAFFQDREGNIWIGTSAGIDRLRRNRLHPVRLSREFDHPAMLPGPDGGVWVGDDLSGVRSFAGSGDGAGTPVLKGRFSAGYRAPDGTLWIGDDQDLRRRAPDGRVTRVPLPEALRGAEAQAIQQDAGGGLWVSFAGGRLFRLADGNWTRDGGLAGFPSGRVMVMDSDWQGSVWMGHADNQVSVVTAGAAGALRRLGAEDGLALGKVLSLHRDGKAMWAGGERGTMLYRDGRFLALRGEHGESFRGVSGITRLPDGDLWLHGADGIFHIGAAGLSAWLSDPAREVAFERFDAQDGLRGHAPQLRPLPSLVRSADGKLWFSTASAIALIDPANIYRNRLAPPVLIRSVSSGGRLVDAEHAGAITLPRGAASLRIAFTALGLSIPERVRLRYRLDGIDHGWQEAVGRRAVSYTNLAPGSYRFEVSAANEDGVWNRQPAALDIRILPTFVQTGWFLLLMALGAALLLYAVYALRVRFITRRMQERLEARLEERSRIARSLHDTLLQSVQGLLMSFNAHKHHVPEGSNERARLERTLGLAGRLLVEGRDQIMDLRASASPDEMRQALQSFGQELAEYSGQAFELRVCGRARALKPAVSDEMYAIGREALFNASRYAGAARVLLVLDYGKDAFTLRIQDNGCGLDEAVALPGSRPGHWGLPGMRERAAAIEASFDLASRPGEGTEIIVRLRAELAYQFSLRAPGQLLRPRFLARRRPSHPAGAGSSQPR